MEKHNAKQIKKLFIRSIIFFNLTMVFWIVACLLGDETALYNTILAFSSLIPGAFYVYYAYNLLTELGIDKFYTKFYSLHNSKQP